MIILNNDDKDVRIGIWMNNVTDKALVGEGISRVLAFVIKATQKRPNIIIVIACLSWMKEPIKRFLIDLGIKEEKIEFIVSSRKAPIIFRLKHHFENRKNRKDTKKGVFFTKIKDIFNCIIKKSSRINSWFLGFTLLIILSPLIIMMIGIVLVVRIFGKIAQIVNNRFEFSKYTIAYFKSNNITSKLFYIMIDAEFEELVNKINRKSLVDCWYFPFPINPYLKKIENTNKVMAVADIVYVDFPSRYQKYFNFPDTDILLRENFDSVKSIISYSDYVKDYHVSKYFKNMENAYVIKHANISTYEYLERLHLRSKLHLKDLSNRLIEKYLRKITVDKKDLVSIYLNNLVFEDIKYIYISSQVREHKNYLTIFKVYENLLRKKYKNLKMIITGDYNAIPELKKFVFENSLEFDIISITQIPAKVHAALYARAELTVVPTLFEGGFPGPFTESLSVGVPVLLSNIPVVQELLNENELKLVTFNPYSMDNILDKIIWAIDNKEYLFNEEIKIYNRLGERTWEDVGDEYIDVFLKSIE